MRQKGDIILRLLSGLKSWRHVCFDYICSPILLQNISAYVHRLIAGVYEGNHEQTEGAKIKKYINIKRTISPS